MWPQGPERPSDTRAKLRDQPHPADGRCVIDTRTMAVVVGVVSLGFGIGATVASTPALGLGAGVLGLLAGLMALVGNNQRPAAPEHTATDAGTAGASPVEDSPQPTPRVGDSSDAARPGHFDSGRPGTPPAEPETVAPPATVGEPEASVDPVDVPAAPAPEGPGATGGEATPPSGSGGPDPSGERTSTPLTDEVTGLFSQDYLVAALEGRLAAARRHLRPVALAVMDVHQGLPGESADPADPVVVAKAITDTVRDSDIACRLDNGSFGLILEDTPENGAVWTVERIRRNLVSTSGHHTMWAGVACYPAHAFEGSGLLDQVDEALAAAREWNQDRIEVAIPE